MHVEVIFLEPGNHREIWQSADMTIIPRVGENMWLPNISSTVFTVHEVQHVYVGERHNPKRHNYIRIFVKQ